MSREDGVMIFFPLLESRRADAQEALMGHLFRHVPPLQHHVASNYIGIALPEVVFPTEQSCLNRWKVEECAGF